MTRFVTLFASLFVCAATSVAQPVERLAAVERAKALELAGTEVTVDLRSEILHPSRFVKASKGTDFQDSAAGSRSVPLAFGLSAILPGAGQFYNRQYVKAGVALALEAAVITGYSLLRTRGINAEDAFQATAHSSWSPVKYASWLNDYAIYLNNEKGGNITAPSVQLPLSIDFTQPNSWTSTEKAAVNAMFSQIRAIERQVFHPETGAAFSHQIPDFAAQQYYELIGKYFQFAPGWNDYSEWKNAQGEFTEAIDPEHTGTAGSKPNVSTSFYQYARDHADAQDTLREASRISLLFIFNHLVAAVDAAVSAKLHNDRLDSNIGLTYDGPGRPAPTVRLRYSF